MGESHLESAKQIISTEEEEEEDMVLQYKAT